MKLEIQRIPIEQKSVLRNLIELYSHDCSEFNDDDIGEHGFFGYKYIDHYWTESGRHPFLIWADGKLAGFVLVRQCPVDVHRIAEFFIMRKYRRMGLGEEVACRIFKMFPGRWEVEQEAGNYPAQSFWRKTIAGCTRGHFEEIVRDRGPVQLFEIPVKA